MRGIPTAVDGDTFTPYKECGFKAKTQVDQSPEYTQFRTWKTLRTKKKKKKKKKIIALLNSLIWLYWLQLCTCSNTLATYWNSLDIIFKQFYCLHLCFQQTCTVCFNNLGKLNLLMVVQILVQANLVHRPSCLKILMFFTKIVTNDSKIIISKHKSESFKHTVAKLHLRI